jgi:D-amino peptidase
MDHSFSSSSIYDLRIDGDSMSEASVNAAYAGFLGVPTVLVSGDRALLTHVQQVFPEGVRTVCTKEGIGRFSAKSRHPEDVRRELSEEAREAVLNAGRIEPLRLDPPHEVELDVTDTLRADLLQNVPGLKRVGGRTVRFHAEDFDELYRVLEVCLTLLSVARTLG